MSLILLLKAIIPIIIGVGVVLFAKRSERLRQQRDNERNKVNTMKEVDKIETNVKSRTDSDLVNRISK